MDYRTIFIKTKEGKQIALDIGEKIGNGFYGTVYDCSVKNLEAANIRMNIDYVMKMISPKKDISEMDLASQIVQNPSPYLTNIITTDMATIFKEEYFIVLMVKEQNTLVYFEFRNDWDLIGKFIFQILSGIDALEKMGYANLDIKPDNILLTGTNFRMRDFGFCGNVNEEYNNNHFMNTNRDLPFRCPQTSENKEKSNLAVSIFMLAIMILEKSLIVILFILTQISEIVKLTKNW